MGIAKQSLLNHEHKRNIAIEIAVEAGVLERCEYHNDAVFRGTEEITEAYKLGNIRFTEGEVSNKFNGRREMTDIIKEVVEEDPADECPFCAKIRDED